MLNHLYIIFEMIAGFLSWVYLWDVYHYWYTCVKPSLYHWEEATLIMMNDLFDVFLTSACKHFTENVCICFHQEDLPVIVCVCVCAVHMYVQVHVHLCALACGSPMPMPCVFHWSLSTFIFWDRVFHRTGNSSVQLCWVHSPSHKAGVIGWCMASPDLYLCFSGLKSGL